MCCNCKCNDKKVEPQYWSEEKQGYVYRSDGRTWGERFEARIEREARERREFERLMDEQWEQREMK